MNAPDAWQQILEYIKPKVNVQSFNTWLRPTRMMPESNGTTFIGVPTDDFPDFIENKFHDVIADAIRALRLPIHDIVYKAPTVNPPREDPKVEHANESIEEDPIPVKAPMIPEICWRGLFADYRDVVMRAGEAPEAFHFAAIAAALSAALGKSVCLADPYLVFPNIFICAVGESSTGKSEVGRFGVHETLLPAVPDLGYINSLASAQGLISTMKSFGQKTPSVVINLSEMRSLIEKSAQGCAGDLIPTLADIFDCTSPLQIPTKNSPVRIDNPPAGIFIAGTTPDWMSRAKISDLTGGLGNRIMFFPGDRRKGSRASRQDFSALSKQLKAIADSWSGKESTTLSFDPDVLDSYWQWHEKEPVFSCKHSLIRALAGRHRNYLMKFCILYAVMDGDRSISMDHFNAARALLDQFAFPSLWYLFSDFSLSPFARLERKIIETVKANGSRGMRVKELNKKFSNGEWSYGAVKHAIDNVAGRFADDAAWDGELRVVTLGRKHFVIPNND